METDREVPDGSPLGPGQKLALLVARRCESLSVIALPSAFWGEQAGSPELAVGWEGDAGGPEWQESEVMTSYLSGLLCLCLNQRVLWILSVL